MCGSVGWWVNKPGIANGRSWVQFGAESVFGGLSQPGDQNPGRRRTDGWQTDYHVSRLPGYKSGILTHPTRFGDPRFQLPRSKRVLAHPMNCRHWSATNKHTSGASDIAFCCHAQWARGAELAWKSLHSTRLASESSSVQMTKSCSRIQRPTHLSMNFTSMSIHSPQPLLALFQNHAIQKTLESH